jgi:hypothetical protein
MIPSARAFIPAGIILVEIAIAIQLTSAREESSEYGNSSVGFWSWLAIGILFAAFMPVTVIATHLAANVDNTDPNLAAAFNWQAVGLAMLALVAHVSILFGGNLAHEAKAFLTFKVVQGSLRRQSRSQGAIFERHAQAACISFGAYMHRLAGHNPNYPGSRIEPGPFDVVTRSLINERYGYEIIQTPNGAVTNGGNGSQPPPTPPSPENQGSTERTSEENNADGENDYLRTILSRKMRDEDSEVRP